MRSTLASASRGLGEVRRQELERTIGVNITLRLNLSLFLGSASSRLDARSPEQPTQGVPLSRTGKVGLTSSSFFIGASITWLACHR